MVKNYVLEGHKRKGYWASASKSLASLDQMNSRAIDINCGVDEMDSPKHAHFSIRGFVTEMRKKNRKTCYPFSSEGKNDDAPLSVPKFRWWQCPNCVPESANLKSPFGMILVDKSDNAGVSCWLNINSSEKEGLFTHNNTQNTVKVDNNYMSDEIIAFNPLRTDGYQAAANVRTTEIGTSSSHFPETNLIQIIETGDKFSDVSHKVCSADNHSPIPSEPEKASLASPNTISYSALPHKRKRKLRSLADIINEEQNFRIQHSRTKSLSSAQTEDDPNPHQPQLDVSSKSMKMPLRKRKNIVFEDEELHETSTPTFPVKKLKGSILESDNNNSNAYKRVEISESDVERDGPTQLNVRITARKKQGLGINRKVRRAVVENRTAGQMMRISSVHYTNLGTSCCSNKGNVGPFFKKSVSGQEMSCFSDLSKDKRPEGGDCSVGEKVPLDLSFSDYIGADMNSKTQESSRRYQGIPDLNELFVDKTDSVEGQQVPEFSERGFALRESSAISNKEPPGEGKSPSGVLNYNNTVVKSGPSSDEMEIVELLAKNQLNRAIDNARKHLRPKCINDSFKRAHPFENTHGLVNFPYANSRTGLSSTSGNKGLGHGFLNFPQAQNCHSDKAQFRHSNPLTVAHQKIPLYPGPNSLFEPRTMEGVDLLWPPKRKKVNFDLANTQSRPVRPKGLDDQSCRCKSVSLLRCDHVKNASKDESWVREGGIGPGCATVGSTDGYSNKTIPAMKLLSLMDQGITGSLFKVDQFNFPERRFSPCNHNLMLNKNDDEKDKFVDYSLFKKTNHINEFTTLLNGARFSGESSTRSRSHVQMPPQNNSKAMDMGPPSNVASQPSRSGARLEICMLNRNPADFSLPDAKNEFMISAKDLKPRKRYSSKGRARPLEFGGPMRK